VITLDGAYPAIVEAARAAAMACGPGRAISVLRVAGSGAVVVQSYWIGWLALFPQWGTGRKHERRIVLADWQRAIVDEYPQAFLRGLIHSAGAAA
jgi:hypothetical protein